MRGTESNQEQLFQYVPVTLESYIEWDHPIRAIRTLADDALAGMDGLFSDLYADQGRPSIPPEQLLRAKLLQSLFSIRSERQLVAQLRYNLLFRWFVGLSLEGDVWDATTFSQNQQRFLAGDVARAFQTSILALAEERKLLSKDHFTVDGTLLQASASMKSFVRKDGPAPPSDNDPGNPTVNFRGEKRSNATHASTTDPDARLARKSPGQSSQMAYTGHLLMENRHGLIVDSCVTHAMGTAERDAAKMMVTRMMTTRDRSARPTLGADKGYDVREFTTAIRALGVTTHIARKRTNSSIDKRTVRHESFTISQRIRKQIEERFGWLKDIAGLRRLRHRGRERVDMAFTFGVCACNLLLIANLCRGT